ncbi:MAG: calcium/sodium antiporter [Victivallaceae bacterium]|nr:calcium/sodium antiporter [Victivallaceae bacterium]
MIIALIQLAAGTVLLYFGAEWLVKGGSRLAASLHVSPLVIGLTLVAFATSAPELTVSCAAALKGQGDIAVGNVVGSNICNITLILGLSAVITPLTVRRQLLKLDAPVMLIAAVLLATVCFFLGGVGRLVGAAFFLSLLVYVVHMVTASRRAGKSDDEKPPEAGLWYVSLLLAAMGLGGLVWGADLFVDGAVVCGRRAGLSEAVIGLTIVAVGTSLPELATSVVAAMRNERDIAVGNVIGSNIFNVLCIMGIAPMLAPLRPTGITPLDWAVMLGVSVLIWIFMATGKTINRLEGALLLAIFIGYTSYLVIR